jgi:hypothetical protein
VSGYQCLKTVSFSLTTNITWSVIDGEPCRVVHFTPYATIENCEIKNTSKMPYCCIEIESKKLPAKAIGLVNNKIDFVNLWKVFRERGVGEKEEIIIFWTTQMECSNSIIHITIINGSSTGTICFH